MTLPPYIFEREEEQCVSPRVFLPSLLLEGIPLERRSCQLSFMLPSTELFPLVSPCVLGGERNSFCTFRV